MKIIKEIFLVFLAILSIISVVFWIHEDINLTHFYYNERYLQATERLERQAKFFNKKTEILNKQLEEKDLIIKDMEESIDVLTFQIHDLVDKHKVGIEKRRRLLIEGKSYFAF